MKMKKNWFLKPNKKGLVFGMLFVLVAAMFVIVLPMNVGADWTGNVTIKNDGTVDPASAPISVSGTTYTLTDDINGKIVIDISGITLDGDGHTLQGTGSGNGIEAKSEDYLTVKDLVITGFATGIKMDYVDDSTITGNTISDINLAAVVMPYTTDSSVTQNSISNCGYGIRLTTGTLHNTVSENKISDISNNGIEVWGSENVIKENSISGISRRYGITVSGIGSTGNKNVISDNSISDVYQYGISITNNNNAVVSGNTISSVERYDGIIINSNTGTLVSGNTISDVSNYGIRLIRGDSCMVTGNKLVDLENAKCGVNIDARSVDNNIVKNDYKESGLPGWEEGYGCVFISQYFTDNNFVFESGCFPQGTGGAKYQVLDEIAYLTGETTNRVVGHKAGYLTEETHPGIGQKIQELSEVLEEEQ